MLVFLVCCVLSLCGLEVPASTSSIHRALGGWEGLGRFEWVGWIGRWVLGGWMDE